MALDVEGVNATLLNFERWLDGTFEGQKGYFARPSARPDCVDYDCPSRVFLGSTTLNAESEALLGLVGQEFTGSNLDVSLTRHASACGGLLVARVITTSESAKRLAPELVRVTSIIRTLAFGNVLHGTMSASDETQKSKTLIFSGGDAKRARQVKDSKESKPNTVAEVAAFVEVMRGAISEHLKLGI